MKEARNHGFTLIELIVVVIVLGILMAIAIPSFLGASDGAKTAAGKSDVTLAYKVVKMAATKSGIDVRGMDSQAAQDVIGPSEPELTGNNEVDVTKTVPDGTTDPGDAALYFRNPASGVVGILHTDGTFTTGSAAAPSGGTKPGVFTLASLPTGYVYSHDPGDGWTVPYTADADGSNPRPILNMPSGGIAQVIDAAGGRVLVVLSNRDGSFSNLALISRAGGMRMLTSDGQTGAGQISPDGSTVAFTDTANHLFLISASGGAATLVPIGTNTNEFWWAGNTHLVTGGSDGKLRLVDLGGHLVQVLGDYSASASFPQLQNADGGATRFCWVQADNRDGRDTTGFPLYNDELNCIDSSDWAAAPKQLLAPGTLVQASQLAISPDGSEIAYQAESSSNDGGGLWLIHTGSVPATPIELGGPGFYAWTMMSWAGAHTVLAALDADPVLQLYRVPDSGAAATLLNADHSSTGDTDPLWLGW